MNRQEIFVGSPRAQYVMSASRNLYLDTGIIRARGRSLATWSLISRARTGALTFIELLGSIRSGEKEFQIRRGAISATLNSDIAVDWQIPNRKIPSAFTVFRSRYDVFDDTIDYLQQLVQTVDSSKSLTAFLERVSGTSLEDALDHFTRLDAEVGHVHRDALAGLVQQTREQYKHPSTSTLLEALHLSATATYEDLCIAMAHSELAQGLLRFAFMEFYCEEQGITDEKLQGEIFNSYDGSIDIYLRAVATRLWRNLEIRRNAARNDGMDEQHLLYLYPGVTLLTTDRSFAEWAAACDVPVEFESAGG